MNSGRVLRLELSSSELAVLTEIMCAQGCSMEEAARHLIANRCKAPRPAGNAYMRNYMRDYRKAVRLGISISEYRKRKHTP
jgi:transposase